MQGLTKCIILLLAVSATARNVVSPVGKVISLLNKLSKEVEAEGKVEAEQYDKFACFCKEQADEKQYNIEKSDALIEKLDGEIEVLDGEITQLGLDVAAQDKIVAAAEGKIKAEKESRAVDHKNYTVEDNKNVNAISAVTRAIKALKESRGSVGGDSDTTLIQVQQLVESLGESLGPGKAHAFKYSSNDIVAVLQKLLATFKLRKKETDQYEFEQKKLSDNLIMGHEISRREAQKLSEEKQATKDEKEATRTAKTSQRSDERDDRAADQNFLTGDGQLTDKCELKAQNWDQRSKTRADELKALGEAIDFMKESESQWGSNKRLNLAGKANKVIRAAPALLQVRAHTAVTMEALLSRTLTLLDVEAEKQHSSILAELVLKIRVENPSTKDHFAKVRLMIKNLVAALKQQAADEAESKGLCDRQMLAELTLRDDARMEVENERALQARKNEEIEDLTQKIKDNLAIIAETNKAKKEGTQLRNEDRTTNEKTIEDAEAGKKATEAARQVLANFYGSDFLQGFVKGESDREGNTVKDLAPGGWSGEYEGKTSQSKGIIGMIDVIISDFDRTITSTTTQEAADQKEYEDDVIAWDALVEKKEDENTKADGDKIAAEGEVLSSQGRYKTQKKQLELAKEALGVLKTKCIDGEESWEERAAARKKEIESLKEAKSILESWDA